ncbi:hypothetical protein DHW03_01535 [Pedobacter yonginense]|uniref:Uncharacterized protein n=1 Tax=Pedobacter yonginense TaxID=651869 RepID=A0A317ERT9_9SPHI|nr:hypothetical protein [Pedobacter yonginense]PWS28563.1 hypothetical protein DHW03_01535 [Pedobacter yonginense]
MGKTQIKRRTELKKHTKEKIRPTDFLPAEMKEIFDKSDRKIGQNEQILLSLLVQIIVEIVTKEEL